MLANVRIRVGVEGGVVVLAFVLVLLVRTGAAEISDRLVPKYHGALEATPARGRIDPSSGVSHLRIGGWMLRPALESNGVYPVDEAILVAIGEEAFRIEKGRLRASRNGRRFAYRAGKTQQRGVRSLRLKRLDDGAYVVRLKLYNVALGRLLSNFPDCVPMAILVGDDDAFTGIELDRKSFRSRRLMVRGGCEPIEDWVWLEECGPNAPPEGC